MITEGKIDAALGELAGVSVVNGYRCDWSQRLRDRVADWLARRWTVAVYDGNYVDGVTAPWSRDGWRIWVVEATSPAGKVESVTLYSPDAAASYSGLPTPTEMRDAARREAGGSGMRWGGS